MHISLKRNPLLKSLFHQQSLIERRSSIPILSYVLLEAKENGDLFLTGTDLEISLREALAATVHKVGQLAVPAHIFHDIVRKLPENHDLDIRASDENTLIIVSNCIEFTLPTLSANDFPKIQSQELPFDFKIRASTLKRLIDDTKFSMSTEEARYSLNGIYFHHHQNQWRAVATDAYRLALSWMSLPENEPFNAPPVIVGRKTIQEMSKLLDECDAEVSFALSSHQLVLKFSDCVFSSRLIEGQFPDYWQAIPQGHPHCIKCSVKELAQAVARVGMVSSEKHKFVKFSFQPNELILSAYSQQYGSAVEKISIDYGGQTFSLGFNPKYFLDICDHMKGENMSLMLKDGVSPVQFQDFSDENVLYILMPIRA
jgi:DNA polymerase-3 subunit beta